MEHKLQLSVFMLLIQVSVAVWQSVTVRKGHTVDLSCPVENTHNTNMDWKNPNGYIMFFKHNKAQVTPGVRNKRYSVKKLSESEFTVSISDVTFSDGGNYTCSQYNHRTTDKTVEVTVLGHPRMKTAKHDGMYQIICTAEGNHHPPQIFWKLDRGPEILADSQMLHEGKKYVSKALLHVQSVEHRVTVKCIVRHPALHAQTLIDFVKIGPISTRIQGTTMANSPTTQPHGSTDQPGTTTGWFRRGETTVYLTSRDAWSSSETSSNSPTRPSQLFPSSQSKTVSPPTGFPLTRHTTSGSYINTSGDNSGTSVSSDSTGRRNDTITDSTDTTGRTSVSETTEEITSFNHTEGNRTGILNDPKMRTGIEGSSALLVFLVTCLIFALLVVVIFFTIKLRRAHLAWKRENEDSNPSEESSKSKSSQEEKNSQGQRRRGVLNTAFTQYVTEEPTVITSVVNTAAMPSAQSVSHPQNLQQTLDKCGIKETEL